MLQCGSDQTQKKRMSFIRAALELRMVLYSYVEVVFRNLYGFYYIIVR